MLMRIIGSAALALIAGPAMAALSVSTNADVNAGMAGFGTKARLVRWDDVNRSSGVDPVTGASVSGSIFLMNWINGPGFDREGSSAADLAINGPENFSLAFAAPLSRVGFAISTGLGLLPNEISAASTSFTLRTSNGETAALRLINPGNGLALWVDVQSSTPFMSLQFSEDVGDLTDQYFGDFVSGAVPAAGGVPEPASWAMLIAGFGLTGAMARRRLAALAA